MVAEAGLRDRLAATLKSKKFKNALRVRDRQFFIPTYRKEDAIPKQAAAAFGVPDTKPLTTRRMLELSHGRFLERLVYYAIIKHGNVHIVPEARCGRPTQQQWMKAIEGFTSQGNGTCPSKCELAPLAPRPRSGRTEPDHEYQSGPSMRSHALSLESFDFFDFAVPGCAGGGDVQAGGTRCRRSWTAARTASRGASPDSSRPS